MSRYTSNQEKVAGAMQIPIENLNGFNRGFTHLGPDQLGYLDHDIKGHWAMVWIKLPKFMEETNPTLTKQFKIYTEMTASNFTGINDYSGEHITNATGRMEKEVARYVKTTIDMTSLSFEAPELQQKLLTDFINKWMIGMGDPNSGRATHLGQLDGGNLRRNIDETGILLYFTMTSDFNYIKEAILYTNITPTKGPKANENGDGIGEVRETLEFKCFAIQDNEKVNLFAKETLDNLKSLRTVQYEGQIELLN